MVAMVSAHTALLAQDTTSPYSKFGYGLLRDNATSSQRAMGGVGYAMRNGRQINVMNPASYAAIDSTTFLFDTGVTLTNLWSDENGATSSATGGGLDYITMQFPICKFMGASIGLLPYSSVGYSFGSDIENGTSTRSGEGGINELYIGLSGRIAKGLTVGANVSYLFGTTYNDVYAISEIGTNSRFTQMMKVRDWHIDLGLQYGLDINDRNTVNLGVVYSPGKTLLGRTMVTTAEIDASAALVRDTIVDVSLKNRFSLPDTWGAGINWEWDRRLMVEADFTYQNWKNAKFPAMDNFIATQFDNRWKVAFGAQFTPAQRGSYLKRINYRAGAFFNHDYVMVNGNNVREWGASIGLGLPAPGAKTVINLGFEYRNRQAHPVALLKENYFNITLGINFNELWFWKNKIK